MQHRKLIHRLWGERVGNQILGTALSPELSARTKRKKKTGNWDVQ